MRAIVSELSATENVRSARIAANFFVGPERWAILVISTFLLLCLLWQQAMGILDEFDLQSIRNVIEKVADSNPSKIEADLRTLHEALLKRKEKLGRSGPREVLDAAIDVVKQSQMGGAGQQKLTDRYRVRRAAEHELRIVDRGRIFFLVGLPLLPTIGFIGTVHSLIEALAIADNIPRARDAVSQVAAVSDVTSTLSLCFSTTFMALSALLVFAPIDLWQATKERSAVEETERMLDDVLLKAF
jgi:hypothetical protein